MNIKWFASLAFLILLEISKTESQDVRVKLCGREFIRMVVTSCGSSRLKRNVLDSDFHFANPHSRFAFFRHLCYPFIYLLFTLYVFTLFCILIHLLIFIYICPFSGNLQKWLDRDLFANQKWTPTAEDEQWLEHDAPESVTEHPAPYQNTSPPAELLEHSTTVQDLSMSSRTRRDVGPAGICCTSGCTMSELIQYC